MDHAQRDHQRVSNTASHRESYSRNLDRRLLEQLAAQNLSSPQEFQASQDSTSFPQPVPPEVLKQLFTDAIDAMHRLPHVCAVDDCFIPINETNSQTPPSLQSYEVWNYSDFYSNPWIQSKLAAINITPSIMDQSDSPSHYDLSVLDPELKGLLLSTHKLARIDSHPNGGLYVCRECADSLRGSSLAPPRFAIANNNTIGRQPAELLDASWAEKAMTCTLYPRACIAVLEGSGQKFSKGHVLTVEMKPQHILQSLPADPQQLTFRVVITGATTDAHKLSAWHTHVVRKATIIGLITYLQQHHPQYKDIRLNQSMCDNIFHQTDTTSLIDLQQNDPIDLDTGNINQSNASAVDEDPGYSNVHHSHVSLSDPCEPTAGEAAGTGMNDESAEAPCRLRSFINQLNQRVMEVRTGTKFRPDHLTGLELIFPHEFPFGRGGTMEVRRCPLSIESCCIKAPSTQLG